MKKITAENCTEVLQEERSTHADKGMQAAWKVVFYFCKQNGMATPDLESIEPSMSAIERVIKFLEGYTQLRPQVLEFAQTMEQQLRNNDWKGHWRDCNFQFLHGKLKEETDEIKSAYIDLKLGEDKARMTDIRMKLLREECADAGNFAMMIHDNFSKQKKENGNGKN